MGFGTSGSLLLVFAGLFVAVGSLYTVTANTAERMADATGAETDQFHEIQQSGINVTSAEWDQSAGDLVVRVDNTGETALDVENVDVLADGAYVRIDEFERREVDGQSSEIWRPGEQLVLEDTDTVGSQPGRVKVVAGPGLAAIAEVVVV